MKIAYAGFDLFIDVLHSLIDNGCEIVKIFSCKVDNITEFNQKITSLADSRSIPITYDKITKQDLISLKNDHVEALICAGYYHLIPIIDDFVMLNIHPSLLPYGRGAWPMPTAILNEDKQSGVTIHKMDKTFDTGDIIMQKSFSLDNSDNLSSFMTKANKVAYDMIGVLLKDFEHYLSNATKQGKGEYLAEPDIQNYIITKDTTFSQADKILRAFYGFFVIYYDGITEHHLLNATAHKGTDTSSPFILKDGYITTR